ncbi:MAG: hypothetical protein JNL32_10495 [Candidatus Kapabacteria bacterium]|nr:hypothetical protein [Candidatus Kapabacteria bacterium]
MSAREHDDLHELILTLTPVERRYFKVHFERNFHSATSEYIKLFDSLAAMPEFDKDKLTKKLRGSKAIEYYSKAKAILTEAIFNALAEQNRGKSVASEVQEGLFKIQQYISRGLQAQAQRTIDRTKSLCYDAGLHTQLLNVIALEEDYIMSHSSDASHLIEEYDDVLAIIQNEQVANTLNRMIYQRYAQYGLRAPDDAVRSMESLFAKLQEHPLHPKAYGAAGKRYGGLALALHTLGKNNDAVDVMMQYFILFKTFPEAYQRNRNTEILRMMNNTLTYAFQTREYEFFHNTASALEDLITAKNISSDIAFVEFTMTRLFCTISLTQDHSLFVSKVEYIENNLSQLRSLHAVRRVDYTFNISLLYMKVKRPDDALRWLNEFFSIPESQHREYVYNYARIFEILLHWKLGSFDLVQSRALSLKRALNKSGQLGDFERILLSFINSATNSTSSSALEKAKQTFTTNLAGLDRSKYAGIVQNYTDLLAWFEDNPE